MKDKALLGAIYALQLQDGKVSVRSASERLGVQSAELRTHLDGLRSRGLLALNKQQIKLTKEGRSMLLVVFVGGGFEIIHPGHIYTINQARRLGDVLVVVVARDSTIRRRKGREPVANESQRLGLLRSLRQVDAAILGAEGNIYETLERVGPDIVALGYDQHHTESDILREAKRRGMKLRVVRLRAQNPDVKTTKLLSET